MRTLLINPPPINGIAFTRQGRCQEREEVLGTTKPPYSLLVCAALFRDRQIPFRLIDQTAAKLTTDQAIAQLEGEGFRPELIVFPSTTPTLDADVAEMARLKARFGAALVSFGPHVSTVPAESMARAPEVDAMIVGEPEDAVVALAAAPAFTPALLASVPAVTWRRAGADGSHETVPHTGKGTFTGFASMPFPAWDLVPLAHYTLPLEGKPYIIVETSRGCPYTCDFCVAPIHQGNKFRERDPKVIVDEIERAKRELGVSHFYLWGDTVTLNAKTFSRFCDELIARKLDVHWFGNARADNLADPAFVDRLKQSGCWMLAMGIESASPDTRKDMVKRLEEEKVRKAFANLRASGIKSFAFFIFGYPGETPAALDQTTAYAIELDPDFANFYPAVPYPGTELYAKAKRDGLLASEDWSRMEYSYYLLRGNGLDEDVVMKAINRAKRRFFLRPAYVARHAGDITRLVTTKWRVVGEIVPRLLFGSTPAPPPTPAAARDRVAAAAD
jgi:anaerobic magnesium-protoporphyrin IX monomethyl ester cyclase